MAALRAGGGAIAGKGRASALDQSSDVARTPLNSSGKSLPSKLQAPAPIPNYDDPRPRSHLPSKQHASHVGTVAR